MEKSLKEILSNLKKYNTPTMANDVFGLSLEDHYDMLVVAPSWTPDRIFNYSNAKFSLIGKGAYISGYDVIYNDIHIAWIQVAAGACNLIDSLIICSEVNFDKLVFLGAVGGLKEDFNVGDICIPTYSVEGTMASAYMLKDITSFKPFQKVYPANTNIHSQIINLARDKNIEIKQASIFCTDSIACEYSQLDFIKSFKTDLIEMETSAFAKITQMINKPSAVILVVSDNSATNEPLVGRDVNHKRYNNARKVLIPEILTIINNIKK